ncbi:MAG: radical SAM protein [Candidatus Aenigmarchaeota archaeon]|nr:radical SAM protein [Candidatus Aenigmarchaeota archaeon]
MKASIVFAPTGYMDCAPLGIGYINSAIQNCGHTTEIHDLNIDLFHNNPRDYQELISFALDKKKHDFNDRIPVGMPNLNVLLSTLFPGRANRPRVIERMWKLAEKYSKSILLKNPDILLFSLHESNEYLSIILSKIIREEEKIPIVFGGWTCNYDLYKELFLKLGLCDIIVQGEGEKAIVELLDYYCGKKKIGLIPQISYFKEGKVIQNKPGPLINIDQISFPDWNGSDLAQYELVPIMGSRGCPYSCSFCNNLYINFRQRNIEGVIEEIKTQKEKLKKKAIFSFDDTSINIDIKWLNGLCDALIGENLDIVWDACARTQNLTPEILKKMKRSGCRTLRFGVESFNQRILEDMNKKITVAEMVKTLEATHQSGIECRIGMVYGYPGESETEFIRNLKILRRLNYCFKEGMEACLGIHYLDMNSPMGMHPEEYGITYEPQKIIGPKLPEKIETMASRCIKYRLATPDKRSLQFRKNMVDCFQSSCTLGIFREKNPREILNFEIVHENEKRVYSI